MNYDIIIKNLNEIKELCQDDSPILASTRIEWLIEDIKKHQAKVTLWDVLTGKK